MLLPATCEEKYQAKTAIDTLFYRFGDLLATLGVLIGVRLLTQPRLPFMWLIVLLSAAMTVVASFIGRRYARRYGTRGVSSRFPRGCSAGRFDDDTGGQDDVAAQPAVSGPARGFA